MCNSVQFDVIKIEAKSEDGFILQEKNLIVRLYNLRLYFMNYKNLIEKCSINNKCLVND